MTRRTISVAVTGRGRTNTSCFDAFETGLAIAVAFARVGRGLTDAFRRVADPCTRTVGIAATTRYTAFESGVATLSFAALGVFSTACHAATVGTRLAFIAITRLATCFGWANSTAFGCGVAVTGGSAVAVLAASGCIFGDTRTFKAIAFFVGFAVTVLAASLFASSFAGAIAFARVAEDPRRTFTIIFAQKPCGGCASSNILSIEGTPGVDGTFIGPGTRLGGRVGATTATTLATLFLRTIIVRVTSRLTTPVFAEIAELAIFINIATTITTAVSVW